MPRSRRPGPPSSDGPGKRKGAKPRRETATPHSDAATPRAGSAVRSTAPKGSKAKKPGGVNVTQSRDLAVRVKTARGRKLSSARWLQRQLNDPYVNAAKRAGYRSRAAFKILEIDDRHRMLKKGARVVDLGAAPGGWTQVAVERAGEGLVVGIDLLEMDAVPGAVLLQGDFLDEDAPQRLIAEIGGQVDVVLSDMAPATTGHKATDHLRIINLCEAAVHYACDVLVPGGSFCAKVLQGGAERDLLALLRANFSSVTHMKPDASRSDSAETYVVAKGFRGKDA